MRVIFNPFIAIVHLPSVVILEPTSLNFCTFPKLIQLALIVHLVMFRITDVIINSVYVLLFYYTDCFNTLAKSMLIYTYDVTMKAGNRSFGNCLGRDKKQNIMETSSENRYE